MKTITVNVSEKYNVYVGKNILNNVSDMIKEVFPSGKIAIVTDDIVDSLYTREIEQSLEKGGFETVKFVFPNGEKSKNASTYVALLNFLAENKLTRTDLCIALGGGVVGDLAGFAAATYLRGIKLVQIPTTLLAMVDSSVGGKTAIDLACGKNLAGAFYQPSLVICDYAVADTLKEETFLDGCSEIIKYALIDHPAMFKHLTEKGTSFDKEYVISECIKMKSDIVCEDEFDLGLRQLLNYGHTIGHAIERLSNYEITHGQAVAAGMAIISEKSALHGFCPASCALDTKNILEKFNLPTTTVFDTEEILNVIGNDKKRKGDTVTLVLPEKTGKCFLKTFPISEIRKFL